MATLSQPAHRLRLVATTALLAALLAGCSNGFHAQTDEIYQPGPGVSVRQDGVYLLNAAIITDGEGHGTLIGALVNQQPATDSVDAITVTGPDKAVPTVTIRPPGTIDLPSHRGVQLADSGVVRITGTLVPGADYELIMTFHEGAPITATVPVLAQSAVFKDVPVGAIPGAVGGTGSSTP